MPRDIPIGNGQLLAAFDLDYQIRDFYYPRVGKENHALGYPWRLGVWLNGAFSWVSGQEWSIRREYAPDALVTAVTLSHKRWPLRLHFSDTIDYEKNLLVRCVRARSLSGLPAELRIFFHTDLNVLENETGDTVFFDPKNACLIHYKGPRYFLMSCSTQQVLGVTRYATGKKRQKGLSGTWKDAEDGELSGNPITQGAVDSVIGAQLLLPPNGEAGCAYWLAAGTSYEEVEQLHRFITIETTPEAIIERNLDYWAQWLAARVGDLEDLPEPVRDRYRRSLLILRTQIDNGGAIIAANDTDIWQFNLDTYSYMWPRDGAIVGQSVERAGFSGLNRRFLQFCAERAVRFNYSASILSETGFLMHKYNPDGSVGSSWHPWIDGDEVQFPIQEDETALVVWDVWQHYLATRDIEGIHQLYDPFVKRAADFMLAFRDEKTGLPLPSYDLWEERHGVFAFTAATVVAGLRAAAHLARLYQERHRAQAWLEGAESVRRAMDEHLYAPHLGRFARGILVEHGTQRRDTTVDASLIGLALFGAYAPDEERMVRTVRAVEEALWVRGPVGGLARYQEDPYQRSSERRPVPGNPWIICTLWLAQYKAALARSEAELAPVRDLIDWAIERSLPSGVMPEQVHPMTGEFLSVSPLTWSHAGFVAAVLDWRERRRQLAGDAALRRGEWRPRSQAGQ